MKHNPGIGPTDELCLRVSVATLARVIFKHPSIDEWILALERKATLRGDKVEVKSQPFGGAIRILDVDAIYDLIGDFHFDNERSCDEQDFRLFIRPSSWSLIRKFCIQHLSKIDDPILETDPSRELNEEFYDALKINLHPEQFVSNSVATVVEDQAVATDNFYARGAPTVRVYRIYEVTISDTSLVHMMITNSESNSDQILCELALKDHQNGGKGRHNAILALPLKQVVDFYSVLPLQERNAPILFEKNRLDETVPVVFENIIIPKYHRL